MLSVCKHSFLAGQWLNLFLTHNIARICLNIEFGTFKTYLLLPLSHLGIGGLISMLGKSDFSGAYFELASKRLVLAVEPLCRGLKIKYRSQLSLITSARLVEAAAALSSGQFFDSKKLVPFVMDFSYYPNCPESPQPARWFGLSKWSWLSSWLSWMIHTILGCAILKSQVLPNGSWNGPHNWHWNWRKTWFINYGHFLGCLNFRQSQIQWGDFWRTSLERISLWSVSHHVWLCPNYHHGQNPVVIVPKFRYGSKFQTPRVYRIL